MKGLIIHVIIRIKYQLSLCFFSTFFSNLQVFFKLQNLVGRFLSKERQWKNKVTRHEACLQRYE